MFNSWKPNLKFKFQLFFFWSLNFEKCFAFCFFFLIFCSFFLIFFVFIFFLLILLKLKFRFLLFFLIFFDFFRKLWHFHSIVWIEISKKNFWLILLKLKFRENWIFNFNNKGTKLKVEHWQHQLFYVCL